MNNNIEIKLVNSINTDTTKNNIYTFGDQTAPLNANTGIERNGGIQNQYIYTEVKNDEYLYYTESGDLISTELTGDIRIIKKNGNVVNTVSAYGIEKNIAFNIGNDAMLTADNTYLVCQLIGLTGQISISEYNFDNILLQSRTVTFTNFVDYENFITSIAFVKYNNPHYIDQQEFAIRLGNNFIILKESNPSEQIILSSGTMFGNVVKSSIVYNNTIVFADDNGGISSFDGTDWKNSGGIGLGTGIWNSGTVLDGNTVTTMTVYYNQLICAGNAGRIGSYDGNNWKNSDGTGIGLGLYNNGTVVGTDNITVVKTVRQPITQEPLLIVASASGRVGSTGFQSGDIWNLYTDITDDNKYVDNQTLLGIYSINSVEQLPYAVNYSGILNYNPIIFGGFAGRVAAMTDGISTAITPVANKFKSLVSCAGNIIAMIDEFSSILISNNAGVTFNNVNDTNFTPTGITYGKIGIIDYVIAVGLNSIGNIAVKISKDNGSTFTYSQNTGIAPLGTPHIAIIQGNIIIAHGNETIYSTDEWATINQYIVPGWAIGTKINGIIETDSYVMVFGDHGQHELSTDDGLTFAPIGNAPGWGTENILCGVNYNTGYPYVYIAGTGGLYAFSTDSGLNFTTASTIGAQTTDIRSVTSGNKTICFVSDNGTYSPGIVGTSFAVWNTVLGMSAINLNTICYNIATTRFVFAGDSGWHGISPLMLPVQVYDYTSSYSFACNGGNEVNHKDITCSTTYFNNSKWQYVVGTTDGNVASFDGSNWKNYDGTGIGTGPYGSDILTAGSSIKCMSVSNNQTLVNPSFLTVAGTNGRVSSFDGTNWKLSNGTGTGTGTWLNNNSIGTINSITSSPFVSFSSPPIWFLSFTTSFAVDTLNNTGLLALNFNLLDLYGSAIIVFQLFLGFDTFNNVYCYRYENTGQYLITIQANNANIGYVIDWINKTGRLIYCTYAIPQTKNNQTRHIITQTPIITTVNGTADDQESLSTVGYSNFDGVFYSKQQYNNSGLVFDSIINYNIGYNYVDCTFKVTGSATDIYNLYAPKPVINSNYPWIINQSNTNTLITGYGKLSNIFTPANIINYQLPFEFRTIYTGFSNTAKQATLSVAPLDSLNTDMMGSLISNVGSFDYNYTPQIIENYNLKYSTILFKNNNGQFNIVKISKVPQNLIQKISQYLYKINTVSPLNIYNSLIDDIEQGSMDYNSRTFFLNTSTSSVNSTKINSTVINRDSNSIDNGDKLITIANPTLNNVTPFGDRINNFYSIGSCHVDTYFDDIYSFSTYPDGTKSILESLVDTVSIIQDTVPTPLGGVYGYRSLELPSTTLLLKLDYDGYNSVNEVGYKMKPFILFTELYLYDGEYIYNTKFEGEILTSSNKDKLCLANGMQLIATAPAEVFFLSDFDNSLYTFTGGRSLTKFHRFTQSDTIINGLFSTKENTLVMQTNSNLIFIRDGIISQVEKNNHSYDINYFFDTEQGIKIVGYNTPWQAQPMAPKQLVQYSYKSSGFNTVVPVPLQINTAYFGANNNMRSILKEYVVTIFNENKTAINCSLTHNSFDQDNFYTQTENYTINKADYDTNGNKRIRLIPKYQRNLGNELVFNTKNECLVYEVIAVFEVEQSAVINNKFSK